MIKPTVGRIVWYYPAGIHTAEPLAAIIAYVHSNTRVNLAVFDPYGVAYSQNAVLLVQQSVEEVPQEAYCAWPSRKARMALKMN